MGSGLVKKRIARSGAGKRGGYRALVANRRGGPWFFIKGFAKSAMDDVDPETRLFCAEAARDLNAMPAASLSEAVANKGLKELNCDAQEEE
ncbi:type II toxin-antitoxin system RelE/ParE family toxin [Roseateles sp.]|uniref:type II toxin-antitoxin system RelE/ParE family toxin n=1 Tax=Roseateles sp. TaxID=1971397 RepID=UPI002F3FC5BA